ncbi:ADP-glyceromanno-heptose 6-epimerase [bacterium]|nr:ADP-glyceromanno-heptose 6-epimerase [bacterium]
MKILVTGGGGFIGSNLVLSLKNSEYEITVIDSFLSGNIKNLGHFKGEIIKEDISTFDLNRKFINKHFDVIVHLASITDTTFSDDREMIGMNVDGFKNVLNFAKVKGAKLVYASSAGTYGRGKSPMQEDQTPEPLNAYALSKKMMDDLAKKEIENKNIIIVGLRYFNVYGPGEEYKGKSASMIYQLFQQMKAGKNPRIFKHGEQKRDFIYVKDLNEANLKGIKSEESCIVNVGTGTATSFNQVVKILNNNLGLNRKCEYFDNPYNFCQDETQADTFMAENRLGFKAKYNIEEGIKDYCSYLLNK